MGENSVQGSPRNRLESSLASAVVYPTGQIRPDTGVKILVANVEVPACTQHGVAATEDRLCCERAISKVRGPPSTVKISKTVRHPSAGVKVAVSGLSRTRLGGPQPSELGSDTRMYR